MDVDAHGLYLAGDVEDVLIIDAWDKDGIDLDDLLELQGLFNAFELLVAQQRRRLQAFISLAR